MEFKRYVNCRRGCSVGGGHRGNCPHSRSESPRLFAPLQFDMGSEPTVVPELYTIRPPAGSEVWSNKSAQNVGRAHENEREMTLFDSQGHQPTCKGCDELVCKCPKEPVKKRAKLPAVCSGQWQYCSCNFAELTSMRWAYGMPLERQQRKPRNMMEFYTVGIRHFPALENSFDDQKCRAMEIHGIARDIVWRKIIAFLNDKEAVVLRKVAPKMVREHFDKFRKFTDVLFDASEDKVEEVTKLPACQAEGRAGAFWHTGTVCGNEMDCKLCLICKHMLCIVCRHTSSCANYTAHVWEKDLRDDY